MTKGKFKSVPEILLAMNHDQRDSIYNHFRENFRDVDVEDFEKLSRLMTENVSVRDLAMQTLQNYLNEKLNLWVVE